MPDIEQYFNVFVVEHIIEMLLYDDKVAVMNYLYSLYDNIEQNTFEWYAKEYFVKRTIHTKNLTAFVLYKLNKRMVMILDDNNKWIEAEPEDRSEVDAQEQSQKNQSFNKIVGFIGYEKKNQYLVFKTKDMTSKRDTGARCDEAGKSKTMAKLNEILGEQKYTSETTKAQKATNTEPAVNAISHAELCVIQEFILRYFNAIEKNGQKWFLTPELAIYYKLYTVNT